MKAIKDDNAKVNTRQWDDWLVNNFRPDSNCPAKVCIPDSYCDEKHGRLFNGLRALAVQWYRRQVLRSFLSYLQLQHGKGTSATDSVVLGRKSKTFRVSSWVRRCYKLKALHKPKSSRARDKVLVDFKKDLIVGSEAVWRTSQSSWWT